MGSNISFHKHDTFEHLGWYEDLQENRHPFRLLGSRRVENPTGRKCGYDGQQVYSLTETVVLKKGHKEVTVKASPQRPVEVRTTLQILCGRIVEKK